MLQPLSELVLDFREHLVERQSRGGPVGYPTGFQALDHYGGAQAGVLSIVGGRPGIGKTALAECVQWNIAKEAYLLNKKYPDEKPWCVVGFSFEQHSRIILRRQAFRMNKDIESAGWIQGTMTDEEYTRIDRSVQQLTRFPVFLDVRPDSAIRDIVEDLKELSKTWRIRFVWQDFLQRLKELKGTGVDRYQGMGDAAEAFSDIAKELDLPFWALSQLKKSEDGKAARPTKEDLFGATMVEGAVRTLYLLHRPDATQNNNPLHVPDGKVELIVDKNNNGETGMKYMGFDAPTVTYTDWEG